MALYIDKPVEGNEELYDAVSEFNSLIDGMQSGVIEKFYEEEMDKLDADFYFSWDTAYGGYTLHLIEK